MISTCRCLVCGTRRLERAAGEIAPFIAHRCRIPPATRIQRVWCPRCDLLFFDQRLDETETGRLYRGYRDEDYVRERVRFEPDYAGRHPDCVDVDHAVQRNRIRCLREAWAALGLPPGRILDFGGGDGWLSRSAFPRGDIVVFDLADGAAAPAPGGFDLVLCAHVLEHVSFPVPFLRRLTRFLGPRGVLYLEVPGPGARPPGASVFDYMGRSMHEHVSFFSGRAVLRLLHRCGLESVQAVTAREATQVFARRARYPAHPLLAERAHPERLPPPVRGPGGLDSAAPPG